ncbi:MAG TPA: mycofactocin biosynthesis peptidyl-dipeptidase MftE [Mycobacteriales bacterium]|nr:mycofactocin biosynthesis peptidyl-dipeptidase MftE [Mycobacteriales bacterium]
MANASRLADLAWTELEARNRQGRATVLAVPLGATEQHGPHLPLSTDTDVAVALCEALAEVRDDVVVAPALAYGSSGEHEGFAGTLSIGQEALELVVVELVRSAVRTFDAVLIVSGHGGNLECVTRAVRRLRDEGHDVELFAPVAGGDAHAGRTETSLMLALSPARVRMNAAVPGDPRPISELLSWLKASGVRSVSPTGVLGDPFGAGAAEGEALIARLAGELLSRVVTWRDG